MVRDRAISSEFLTHRVVQEYSVPKEKISVFAKSVRHFWQPSWILAENEKNVNISEKVFLPL